MFALLGNCCLAKVPERTKTSIDRLNRANLLNSAGDLIDDAFELRDSNRELLDQELYEFFENFQLSSADKVHEKVQS